VEEKKYPRILTAGDGCVVIEYGDTIDMGINSRVAALGAAVRGLSMKGIRDTVPTYRSLAVYYDPEVAEPDELYARLEKMAEGGEAGASGAGRRIMVAPTLYGGEHGPDLANVAAHTKLSEEEVIKRHAAHDCYCYMLGFTPGFPYLGNEVRGSSGKGHFYNFEETFQSVGRIRHHKRPGRSSEDDEYGVEVDERPAFSPRHYAPYDKNEADCQADNGRKIHEIQASPDIAIVSETMRLDQSLSSSCGEGACPPKKENKTFCLYFTTRSTISSMGSATTYLWPFTRRITVSGVDSTVSMRSAFMVKLSPLILLTVIIPQAYTTA
jgi:hypothetical protein